MSLVIEEEGSRVETLIWGNKDVQLKLLSSHYPPGQILVLANLAFIQAVCISLLKFVHWVNDNIIREKKMLVAQIPQITPWMIVWNTGRHFVQYKEQIVSIHSVLTSVLENNEQKYRHDLFSLGHWSMGKTEKSIEILLTAFLKRHHRIECYISNPLAILSER